MFDIGSQSLLCVLCLVSVNQQLEKGENSGKRGKVLYSTVQYCSNC